MNPNRYAVHSCAINIQLSTRARDVYMLTWTHVLNAYTCTRFQFSDVNEQKIQVMFSRLEEGLAASKNVIASADRMRALLKQVSQQLQRKSIPQLPRQRYGARQLSTLLPMLKLCDVVAAFGDFFMSWERVMTGSFCGPLKVVWGRGC